MGLPMNWLDISLGLQDHFDYDEFVIACVGQDLTPLSPFEYAQKVGMLMVAQRRFKRVSPETAYKAFIQEMNSVASQRTTTNSTGGCGGCGKKS